MKGSDKASRLGDRFDNGCRPVELKYSFLINVPEQVVFLTVVCQRIDDNARRLFRFLTDPHIKNKIVNTTCERCSVPDCGERAVAPIFIEKMNEQKEVEAALQDLSHF